MSPSLFSDTLCSTIAVPEHPDRWNSEAVPLGAGSAQSESDASEEMAAEKESVRAAAVETEMQQNAAVKVVLPAVEAVRAEPPATHAAEEGAVTAAAVETEVQKVAAVEADLPVGEAIRALPPATHATEEAVPAAEEPCGPCEPCRPCAPMAHTQMEEVPPLAPLDATQFSSYDGSASVAQHAAPPQQPVAPTLEQHVRDSSPGGDGQGVHAVHAVQIGASKQAPSPSTHGDMQCNVPASVPASQTAAAKQEVLTRQKESSIQQDAPVPKDLTAGEAAAAIDDSETQELPVVLNSSATHEIAATPLHRSGAGGSTNRFCSWVSPTQANLCASPTILCWFVELIKHQCVRRLIKCPGIPLCELTTCL